MAIFKNTGAPYNLSSYSSITRTGNLLGDMIGLKYNSPYKTLPSFLYAEEYMENYKAELDKRVAEKQRLEEKRRRENMEKLRRDMESSKGQTVVLSTGLKDDERALVCKLAFPCPCNVVHFDEQVPSSSLTKRPTSTQNLANDTNPEKNHETDWYFQHSGHFYESLLAGLLHYMTKGGLHSPPSESV
ncbi:GPN-loop GTPase 1 isoform X1 [Cucumis melo var. makuwa]|uniref:GPN-loop GTPase 1 isoform X1 n=1 Tax=Cucumis melo var. makuwa TaxID=1194695 RepID=A0A5A7TFW6_CUCMM|nr:GPN-loop GTPase 1 isoform X1 [Cucumis melo var. makuwa]TYK18056.1 GPN-loop GTPase 1 isoform X1 [Cucumis melo var. makuwa]